MSKNTFINDNCLNVLKTMANNSVDFTLTDIPYASCSRHSNGLRKLDFGKADILTFDLTAFCSELLRVSKNSILIFCGTNQLSHLYEFFRTQKGTTRTIVWHKTNPSPMNGQHIYLSGVEFGIWFKKQGAKTFNTFCKNPVFMHPVGSKRIHPTEKNHKLLREIILDNTNEGDIVFDPCSGSGSTCLVAHELNRKFIGVELDTEFYALALNRLKNKGAL